MRRNKFFFMMILKIIFTCIQTRTCYAVYTDMRVRISWHNVFLIDLPFTQRMKQTQKESDSTANKKSVIIIMFHIRIHLIHFDSSSILSFIIIVNNNEEEKGRMIMMIMYDEGNRRKIKEMCIDSTFLRKIKFFMCF